MKLGQETGGREEGRPLGGDDTAVRCREGTGQREVRTSAPSWAWQTQKPRGRNTAVSVRDRREAVWLEELLRGENERRQGQTRPIVNLMPLLIAFPDLYLKSYPSLPIKIIFLPQGPLLTSSSLDPSDSPPLKDAIFLNPGAFGHTTLSESAAHILPNIVLL